MACNSTGHSKGDRNARAQRYSGRRTECNLRKSEIFPAYVVPPILKYPMFFLMKIPLLMHQIITGLNWETKGIPKLFLSNSNHSIPMDIYYLPIRFNHQPLCVLKTPLLTNFGFCCLMFQVSRLLMLKEIPTGSAFQQIIFNPGYIFSPSVFLISGKSLENY